MQGRPLVSCDRATRGFGKPSLDALTFETNRAALLEEEYKLAWMDYS